MLPAAQRTRIGAVRANVVATSLGMTFSFIPLFPAFITLTAAPIPGVSLLPRPLTLALFACETVAVGAWIASLLTAPRRPVQMLLPLLALPATALLAAALGFRPGAGMWFIVILAFGVIAHATIVRFFREPNVAASIMWSYVVSGALASTAAIVMVVIKTPASLYTIGHGRAVGTFVLPGELAGYLIVYLPVAFALARSAPDPRLRIAARAGLIAATIAFVMTFSRAGWFGMAGAVAAFALLRFRGRGAGYAVAAIASSALAIALVFNAHHDPSENFTRLSIWQAALAMALRFPLSGVGPFGFAHLYPLVRAPDGEAIAYHAHSVVLTIAAETGLLGLAAVAACWWRFAVLLRSRLRMPSRDAGVSLAIAAGLAGTWVQGLIDTVTVVIFGLWLPMMALALACAEPARTSPSHGVEATVDRRSRLYLTAGAVVAGVLVACSAVVQLASTATFARAASPRSAAAHLSPRTGADLYAAIAAVAPLPFVEAMAAENALQQHDVDGAVQHAARMPAGRERSELLARAADARGDGVAAIRLFLDAGDDEALQSRVDRLVRRRRLRDAYALEARIRDRVATTVTRPNALADSSWRLAGLAARLGDAREAARDVERAIELAPLNTKYLDDAGSLALERRDHARAYDLFSRAADIDPNDADAVAGMGLAALQRGDVARAVTCADRAERIDARSALSVRLRAVLRSRAAPVSDRFRAPEGPRG